jgi:hypothetical protein
MNETPPSPIRMSPDSLPGSVCTESPLPVGRLTSPASAVMANLQNLTDTTALRDSRNRL